MEIGSIAAFATSIVGIALGSSLGSYLAAYAKRIGRQESIATAPSTCQTCHQRISWLELIPIISWIALRGKCSSCGAVLSKSYLITEVTFGVVGLILASNIDLLDLSAIAWLIALSCLWICILTDFDQLVLPVIPMGLIAITGLAYHGALSDQAVLFNQIWSMLVGVILLAIPALLYFIIRKTVGFGEGDYYLMAALGAWSSSLQICLIFYAGIFSCLAWAFISSTIRNTKLSNDSPFPLGAFIALAGFIFIFGLLFEYEWPTVTLY